eukprot:GGOE01021377.1.p2 GENE.GGOE01021377.1~~GGOE01021377.1.p2  ORF type:complete len:140 (-),score=51.67 GGOE01021377.1:532-924(-)
MAASIPTRKLFLKLGCPFCAKLTTFLAEAGLSSKVTIELDTEENRNYITQKVGKCTFPALEVEPGKIILESGDIIDLFAKEAGVDPASLPLHQYYMNGLFKDVRAMMMHIKEKEGPEALPPIIAAGRTKF